MVAAGLLPGVSIESFWGALLVAAVVAALNAVIPPVLAALRLPLTFVLGFLLVLVADAFILRIADDLTDGDSHRRQLRLGAAGRAGRRRGERGAGGLPRLRRHVLDSRREAHRAPAGRDRHHPGPGDHLPGDRRARPAGAASRDARRQRPEHGRLDGRGDAPPDASGRPICRHRRAPARPGSCSVPTRTSRRFAGWRRRPRR